MARKSLSEMPNVVGKPKFTANVFANILVVVAIIAIPLMYGGDPLFRIPGSPGADGSHSGRCCE